MENVKATWYFELLTQCPRCEESLDLNNLDGYSYVSDLRLELCERDTVMSKNIEVECPHCDNVFYVDCEY